MSLEFGARPVTILLWLAKSLGVSPSVTFGSPEDFTLEALQLKPWISWLAVGPGDDIYWEAPHPGIMRYLIPIYNGGPVLMPIRTGSGSISFADFVGVTADEVGQLYFYQIRGLSVYYPRSAINIGGLSVAQFYYVNCSIIGYSQPF